MADAPEVVPSSFNVDRPQQHPSTTEPSPNGLKTLDASERSSPDGKSPVSPAPSPARYEGYDEKQALSNDEMAPKTAITNEAETEESNPKFAYAQDDKAGTGLETATADNSPAAGKWHFDFWDCLSPNSLFLESLCCPCVLAGRTHLRLHQPDNAHFASTNGHCAACLALSCLTVVPLWCFLTISQRREIRYRYHIPGDNGEDCWKTAFCVCCALVQEEKEVVWQEEQRRALAGERLANEQPGKRTEAMAYNSGSA